MSDATTKQETAQAPAGWWPDVNQPGWERYWNGTSWEDATRRTPVVPEPHRETFVKPKRSIWPWVAGGSAVGVFLIGAVILFIIIVIAIIASAASGASQKVELSDRTSPPLSRKSSPRRRRSRSRRSLSRSPRSPKQARWRTRIRQATSSRSRTWSCTRSSTPSRHGCSTATPSRRSWRRTSSTNRLRRG